LIGTFVAIIRIPAPLYIVLIVSVLVVCGTQAESIGKHLKKADWNLILFILAIFMISACLNVSGLLKDLSKVFSTAIGNNVALAVVLIIFTCALIGSFFSKTAAIIIFSTIINDLLVLNPPLVAYKDILAMALVIGVVLGGNMVPQASSHLLKTLSITRERQIDRISQRTLTKNSIIFISIALAAGLMYTLAFLYA
ncbi:MAG: SLC13 family permease, partial [Candidatus Sigynarchaeota archaeon]